MGMVGFHAHGYSEFAYLLTAMEGEKKFCQGTLGCTVEFRKAPRQVPLLHLGHRSCQILSGCCKNMGSGKCTHICQRLCSPVGIYKLTNYSKVGSNAHPCWSKWLYELGLFTWAMGHSLGLWTAPLQSSFPHLPSAVMSNRASWWQSSRVSIRAVVFLSPTEMSHCLSCSPSPVSAWC